MIPGFLRLPMLWVLLLALSSGIHAEPRPLYSAIIDAGSSGSRIYLYQSSRTGQSTQIQDLWGFEPQDVPGLSEFKAKAKEAFRGGILPLLSPLQTWLEGKGLKESEVTVHVLATGGLRLLDATQSEAILKEVGRGLQSTRFSVGRIGILPSELEGVLAWADLNALLGRLGSGKETLGIVEIGGASSQIAYQVKGQKRGSSKSWQFQGHTFEIFSRSFLGLGQNAARKAMIHSAGGGLQGNPCYPEGVSVADKKTEVEGLTGAFHWERCKNLYRNVIRNNPDFDPESFKVGADQSFAGIGQGNPVGPIKGSISFWKLKGTNPHDSLGVVEAACRKPWPRFQEQYGSDLVHQNQCANSIFIETFLYDASALGLASRQVKHIEAVGERVPSWTRGFLLLPDGEFH